MFRLIILKVPKLILEPPPVNIRLFHTGYLININENNIFVKRVNKINNIRGNKYE